MGHLGDLKFHKHAFLQCNDFTLHAMKFNEQFNYLFLYINLYGTLLQTVHKIVYNDYIIQEIITNLLEI